MSLKCGIVGLPNVGKSSCFNILNRAMLAPSENYPFCTIDPNHSKVIVPDHRLENLAKITGTKNIIPATVEFVDIAGLVSGASKGEGRGNAFLSHVRNVDALIHVVRCFEDPEIEHVAHSVDPIRDLDIINTELVLKDLEILETFYKKQEKLARASKGRIEQNTLALLTKVKRTLETGKRLNQVEWSVEELEQLKPFQFLTMKPVMYLANVSEKDLLEGNGNENVLQAIKNITKQENTQCIVSCIKLEETFMLSPEKEKNELFQELGYEPFGIKFMIQAAYSLLGLQTFFTAGPEEVRGWTIPMNATAPEAAGVIHSDFQKGFIAAEIVSYDDFIQYQGLQNAKKVGKCTIGGKNTILKDGDVVLFRFNV